MAYFENIYVIGEWTDCFQTIADSINHFYDQFGHFPTILQATEHTMSQFDFIVNTDTEEKKNVKWINDEYELCLSEKSDDDEHTILEIRPLMIDQISFKVHVFVKEGNNVKNIIDQFKYPGYKIDKYNELYEALDELYREIDDLYLYYELELWVYEEEGYDEEYEFCVEDEGLDFYGDDERYEFYNENDLCQSYDSENDKSISLSHFEITPWVTVEFSIDNKLHDKEFKLICDSDYVTESQLTAVYSFEKELTPLF